jgi:Uncharacterized protein conserved in bacteria
MDTNLKHVADLKMMETSDTDIWKWARQSKSIIISKDEDFVILHSADSQPVPLIWVRVGNTRRKVLLEWFERQLPIIEEKLASGELLVELNYTCKCLMVLTKLLCYSEE